MSSDSESDDDTNYERKKIMVLQYQHDMDMRCSGVSSIVGKYCKSWVMKAEPRTSRLTSFEWLQETIGTPGETYTMLRMNAHVFFDLHDKLVAEYGLKETWSRCGPSIKRDKRAFPHLKDCIGAIDGTHIRASIPEGPSKVRYIGRTGATTQNVMAVCDFDMHFTYASIGQPGSMHDTSVLFHAIENDKAIFPHPPKGKYYLVDAGYPNRDGYLAPYKGERYHVPDFQRGAPPTTPVEKFNRLHSSKRNTIERTFGVWKMKWQILLKMPNYSIATQKMIVAATMTLHNYVRLHDKEDLHFLRCERDPDYVPTIPDRYKKYAIPSNASDASTTAESGPNMDLFRHELATAIALSW
nr:uncharacterized protein LOC109774189 isoform X1 [Aegilops tauschii subsp. strangulata]XP_040260595.1 uncharacterized protein LOC109774189 isoform X1 [Aegilops tauschii subsp. strangulata]